MSLDVELDCDGLLSKQDEMAIDTSDSNSILRNIDELKDEEVEDDDNDDNNSNNSNYCNLDSIKHAELMEHLKNLCREYAEKVHSLEESLDHVTRENEAYDSQIAALKQHNEYLREASNQCHTRYNDTKIALLNSNEEIITLKTELTNLQLLYQQNVEQIENDNKIILKQTFDENDINNTLKEYIEENKQIKKENIKYLNQLKEMNNKYRESNTKYDDLNNIQIDLQNELNEAKSRIFDLDSIIHEYFLEIRYLEHQNGDLKQTLNEITNAKEVYDENGNAIPISYAPDIIKRKRHWRTRSISQASLPSSCNSPTAVNFAINAELLPYGYAITNDDDQYDDDDDDNNDDEQCDTKKNHHNNDEMEKLYDLYQAMNDYLDEIEECVQSIKSIKTIQLLNKKRSSSTRIPKKYRKNKKNNNDDIKQKEEEEKEDDDDDDDDDDDEIDPETICTILDKNEEQEQLARIADIIEESKECIKEMHKQQMVMMTAEKIRYSLLDTTYKDLDSTYKQYQTRTARKIKQLTKDMYTVQYKKYVGYREICWEMVGNVGTYTKDKIIYKLTH